MRCLPASQQSCYANLITPPFSPVLDRLGQVRRADVRRAGQVGDRARELEHAVVGARRRGEVTSPLRRMAACISR